MPKAKQLTKRQLAVIEDLFTGGLEEQEIFEKHRLSRKLYNKWWDNNAFKEQFEKRIADAYYQSSALIANYATTAAVKLIQLTNSDKPETARKACLDIISMPMLTAGRKAHLSNEPQSFDTQPPVSLNAETAGKLLAVLAEEKL